MTDHLGGGENIRSKDFLAIDNSPCALPRHADPRRPLRPIPGLRGGVIEEGASWVVSWMHQLDFAQRAFRRTEEPLRNLHQRPSEYVRQHLKFTPFPGEPVGWMIEQAGAELFMFSTDFPHPEGGRIRKAKFEDAMPGVSEEDQQRFYYSNMAELLGPALVPTPARSPA